MSKIMLNDVRVYLDDLLRGPKRAELDAIPSAVGYAALTDGTLTQIEALPPGLLGGVPNAEELSETDARHDGFGEALLHLAKAVRAYPDATPEQRQAAKFIQENLVASRGELRASYATEAGRASERRQVVEAARSTLEGVTILSSNAYAWATSFLDAGAMIGALLAGRADALVDRSPAGLLRSKAIRQIHMLRELVADAHETNPAEARRLDARFFGYFDLLESMRERGSTEGPPPPPADPAPPA